jgi:YD repeat-containing protein
VPAPTPVVQGASGDGGASPADFSSSYAVAGTRAYAFYFPRFLVSPSYDQLQSLSSSLSFSGPAAYDLNSSFDFFALSMLQAGGAKVVFSSNRDGHVQIYLMNADGSGQSRLTNSGGNDDAPRFSPSGAKILFQSDRDDPVNDNNDIYVMNSDGTGQTRLTTDASDDCAPSWSPDGTKVVFQSLRNGQYYQVYSMNADGSGQLNLSNSTNSDRQPSWSPNGAKIAFASERDHAGYASIYVMNSNGTAQQRLTFSADTVTDEQPVWSHDGSRIAFVSTRDGDKEIYVMNADGTNQTRLTADPGNDDSPSWSPDGSKLIFRSDRQRDCCDPTAQVWVMKADGTSPANLSGNQFGDYSSSWSAGGSGNQPPVANAGGSYSGMTGQNTVFNGAGSFDPDGQIASYSWSFGDGGTGSGVSPTHAYSSSGSYTITLTITDNLGAQGSATTTVSVSSSSSDGFVQNFLQWGLARQPHGDEGSYWTDIMRAAYPRGQGSMLLSMREFGMTVFESAEYAARARSDHWYVYDLYKSYLMRDPDPQGWAWWESQLPSMGREQLRHAFDESIEFGNIVATLTASGTPSSAVSSLATARVDPFNETGDQLRARDCEWSVGLLSLPGRAGLDLGLGLSYSSLVWMRSGPYAYFDEDRGSPSPGFRLGFATIRGPFFDAQVGRNVYMLVSSRGSRTELRQVGTTSTYEAGDSSYLQLIAGSGSLLLRTTDGMQMSYAPLGDGWRAATVEDRNGNYINVSYDWRGDITNMTDTLGRVVTFNYDTNANLSTITQTWQVNGVAQAHTWASFGWGTQPLQQDFSSIAAVGTYSGEVVPVLTQVGLDDGTRYNFEYTGAGQVRAIRRYTSDNVERSHTIYDYATLADDCPRVIDTRVWADNWTGTGGVPSEVVTQFADPGDGSHEMIAPDGTVYKESYGTGWQKGMATGSEVRSGGVLQRQTTTQWVQDDMTVGVGYQTNPRVIETNIYDFPVNTPSNRRRTTIDYGSYAQYGLPHLVTEFAGDGVHELRRSYTDYNLTQPYLDHRIIGLPSEMSVVDGPTGNIVSREVYQYDRQGDDGWGDTYFSAQAPSTGYADPGYVVGRGNLSAVRRYNCANNTTAYDDNQAVWVRLNGHDIAGSVVWTKDAGSPRPGDGVIVPHRTGFSYADSFSDGNNSRNTFAYPTTLTDADGFSSSVQYSFDFGAKTRMQGPPPANQPNGIIQTFTYDSAARIQQVTTTNNGAYTRYLYGPNYVATQATVNAVADEAYTNTVFDGVGRPFTVASNNPSSTGGYKAQVTKYDVMGRAVKQSNPADTDNAWNPVGPDDGAGWLYTQQSYDWKGRPKVTTNTDGTQKSATYDGCGCAGGEVMTLTDEMGRQQKVYSDPLGREWKTEVLNWDGSVYSTITNTFNARDQVTLVRQYQGTEGSGVYQETVTDFDGYGRLQSRHAPEQDAGQSTVYVYNPDDTVYSVTDARGASSTYTYNHRHLVTGIGYSAPAGITAPPSVTYDYDGAGNRISMADGSGSTTYQYNTLSQLEVERKHFNGLSDPNNSFPITYSYNLAGEPKSITDSFNATVGYDYDRAGRLGGVTNTGFANQTNVANYATNMRYRAWGGLKRFSFGASGQHTVSVGYDERLRVHTYEIDFVGPSHITNGNEFQYYDDGKIKYSREYNSSSPDRAYAYDAAGHLTQALTGAEARGEAVTNIHQRDLIPFRHDYQFDVWGNMKNASGWHWSHSIPANVSTYVNNRNQAFTYDAEGHVTVEETRHYIYDAAGRMTLMTEPPRRQNRPATTLAYQYDGDGQRVQTVGNDFDNGNTHSYELRSSLLKGQVLTSLSAQGQKASGNVYANGELLAIQSISGAVTWMHNSPDGSGHWATTSYSTNDSTGRSLELDPLGQDVGLDSPYVAGGDGLGNYPNYGDAADLTSGCALDGSAIPCEIVGKVISRNPVEFLTSITIKRMGVRAEQQGSRTIHDGSSILIGSADNEEGVGYTQTVMAGPDRLSTETVGYNMIWLSLAPVQKIIPKPKVGGQATPDDKAAFDKAYAELVSRLKGDCAKIFGGAEKALKKFGKADIYFADLDPIEAVPLGDGSGKNRYKGNNAEHRNGSIFINVYGSFTTGFFLATNSGQIVPEAQLAGMTAVQNAAFILFHELGHLVKGVYGKNDNDANNPQAVAANNKLIMENCFKDIKQ